MKINKSCIAASLVFVAALTYALGESLEASPPNLAATRPQAVSGSGVYAVPAEFYGSLNVKPESSNELILAAIVSYKSANGATITLQMSSTWVGQSGQDPRIPQRLVVVDGILDPTITPTPITLWDDHGTPLGRDRVWKPHQLAAKQGFLSVIPLQQANDGTWTQNNTRPGNPYMTVSVPKQAVTTYEDSNAYPGSTRPDIVATISAPNVNFSIPTAQQLADQRKRRAR